MSDFEFTESKVGNKKTKVEKPAIEPANNPTPVAEKAKEDKAKYTPEELAKIFDEIIFTGEYTEEVTIKGKLKVTLRTRSADELNEISKSIDLLQANLIATIQEKRMIMNLQYALVRYHTKDLSGMKMDEKAKFIGSLASPIIGALIDEMIKFDTKIEAAFKEGEENF